MRIYSPVDDVSSLYEDIHFSGPIPVVVHYASQLQDLFRVGKVAVKVAYRDNLPDKLSLGVFRVVRDWDMAMFAFLETVVVNEV